MSRRPNDARISRRKVEEGVREQPESDLRDNEQDRGNEGIKDHAQGSADGEETRVEIKPPVIPQYVQDLIDKSKEDPPKAIGSMDYQRQEDIFKRRSTAPVPELKYDEHWRGKVGNSMYRLIIWRAYSFVPERISLERMISQGSEPETWTAEVMPQ